LRAIVEGPYGKEIHLDEYGTVLLFATDIGIAGQLLEDFNIYNAKSPCSVPVLRLILPPTMLAAAVSLRGYTYE